MAYLLVQGGASLYKVDPTTGTATVLTLPTGVTLSTTRKPKFAILNQFVVITNSPSVNLVVDPEGTVRVMVPRAPFSGPNLAVGSGTGYTGSRKVKQSFIVKGSDDAIMMESALSPPSASVAFANQDMSISRVAVSLDAITARRLYTTLTGGTVYYYLMDVDDNTGQTAISNMTDAALQLLPVAGVANIAPAGTLPSSRLKNVVSWKSRLWAVADEPTLVDTVVFSETNSVYKWPNSAVAYPQGQDSEGIVAFAPRKDQLGILKRNGLWQITGTNSGSSGISTSSVALVQVVTGKAGCIAPDSVVVVNDKVYWLGNDGVWEWGANGVENISNDKVKPWFDRASTYFNPARFPNAFAKLNVTTNSYELHLAANGSSTEDRWVGFNLTNRKWYGPHKTGAFTPSHAMNGLDASGLPTALVGGTDGVVYVANRSTYTDGTSTAIDLDCYGPFHSGDAPDIEHHWGHLSMLTKIEAAGTLSVTPTVGRLNASAQAAISHDLTKGREKLRILGDGAMLQLRMQQATVAQGAVIYGYEVDPVFENGRR